MRGPLLLSFKFVVPNIFWRKQQIVVHCKRTGDEELSAKMLYQRVLFYLFFFFFFKIASTQGRTIKTSSSLDVVTLRFCSIAVMTRLPSIFALLSGFCTQKSNYGLLYIKVLICYYGEGQRASFVCSLHWSQMSMNCYALHFLTLTALHFNIYQCKT